MHPYPVRTMIELSVLGWAGFILIPLFCEVVVMILIFRIPWRWAIQAILLASVVNWCVSLLGLHGLWLFADKFVGFIYFLVGTPLKAIVVSGFFAFRNIKSDTENRITRDVLKSIGWAITTGVISWIATLDYLSFLNSHYTLWRWCICKFATTRFFFTLDKIAEINPGHNVVYNNRTFANFL